MGDRLRIDADFATAQIGALIAAYPELQDDEQLLRDALEGETDFDRVMPKLLNQFLDRVAMKEATASQLSDLRERASRFDRNADALKLLMFRLLNAAGLSKLELPVATLSVRDGSQSVSVIDEQMLPQGFFTRTPDKTAIKKAILAGEGPPGAELVRGEPSLSIRTK